MSNGNKEDLDLRLALGYSDQNNASRVKNESGAGVNAGTTVGMTFAASDPLSELVWSPHKGLSLKCTGSGLADKKPFLLWNVGSNNVTHHSPSQSNIFEDEGKDIGIGKLLVTEAMSLLDMEDVQRIHLGKSSSRNVLAPRPSCGNEMGNSSGRDRLMNTGEGFEIVDTNKIAENVSKKRKKDASPPQHIQITENNKYNNAGPGEERAPKKSLQQVAEDNGSGNQILGLGLTVSSEIRSSRKLGPQVARSLNLVLPQQESNEKAASLGEESGGKREHLEKQESSAENDKQKLVTKEGSEQNEKGVMRENSVPLETSLALRRRKGKEKVYSDGNGNSRMSSNEEDSHESVDSCNSTRMFPQGKRQLQLEQPLLVGGKRIKTEMQGHTASTSNVGNDSSFMTWISNMVNGFPKTNREEAPLPLPLAHSLPGNERNRGEIITYGKNHDVERNNTGFQTMFHLLLCPPSATPEPRALKDDPSTGESKEVILPGNDESNHGEIVAYDKNHNSGSENTGFQSMFRSLFRPPSVMPEKRMLKDDPPTRESKEVMLADKMIIEASPISCHRESSGSDEQIFVSKSDKVITSALAHRDGISTKFPIKSFDACKSTSTEKKSSGNSSSRKTTEGGNSSGSLRKLKTRNGNNNSSSHPSESKAVNKDLSNTSVSHGHGNLWITRFCVKDHPTATNLDEFKEKRDETTQRSPDCTRSNPNAAIDQKDNNKNAKFPSPKLKSSEAMASLFARRLDAIKHIVPSTPQNEAMCSRTTCFFCGRRGHDLRNCSEVTETELESLLRNVSSYDGTEDLHSLCIRCLQLNHWAITCPLESSGKQQQQEHGNSVLNSYCASNLHIRPADDDENYPNFLAKVQGDPSILSNHIGNDTDADNLIANGKLISFERMVESIKIKENMAPDLVENVVNENNLLPSPSSTLGSNDIGGIPKGAFDAIRRIRVSRGTILKWINSKSSLSHLDGFFLRLRIGKHEAELGRTGYYVARIAGTQKENPATDSKKFISVSVGSVKCFVGCQYVSNHDFLEDELLAWWSRTSESGGKVPSEDELRLKLEERTKLGF
nr:Zinc finger, CCHC-type domain containing protein [Ipomoea batatas]